jgi:hypothetical protein
LSSSCPVGTICLSFIALSPLLGSVLNVQEWATPGECPKPAG